jgi:hypothetical protein
MQISPSQIRYLQKIKQTQKKTHISTPRAEFEAMIPVVKRPVFQWANIFRALDRSANALGLYNF